MISITPSSTAKTLLDLLAERRQLQRAYSRAAKIADATLRSQMRLSLALALRDIRQEIVSYGGEA